MGASEDAFVESLKAALGGDDVKKSEEDSAAAAAEPEPGQPEPRPSSDGPPPSGSDQLTQQATDIVAAIKKYLKVLGIPGEDVGFETHIVTAPLDTSIYMMDPFYDPDEDGVYEPPETS